MASVLLACQACASLPPPSGTTEPKAQREAMPDTASAAADHATPPPAGFIRFCREFADQCAGERSGAREILLTDDRRAMLVRVNAEVNGAIVAMDDSVHYGRKEFWTLPSDGYGDCDDYVLAKRRALIELGLPPSALRIAIVLTDRLVRHAVLTIATDQGTLVLDNLRDDIVVWDRTNYAWLERQDPSSATGWVSLR